jgi:hypothetical protein
VQTDRNKKRRKGSYFITRDRWRMKDDDNPTENAKRALAWVAGPITTFHCLESNLDSWVIQPVV